MNLGDLSVGGELWVRIIRHAESDYPGECCGVALACQVRQDEIVDLIPCRNAEDEFHTRDPEHFPRTSASAYFIDPKDLLKIEQICREQRKLVRLVYHSHPDAEAYFSDEDVRQSVMDGEPLMPDAWQLVVSVKDGTLASHKTFRWDTAGCYALVNASNG